MFKNFFILTLTILLISCKEEVKLNKYTILKEKERALLKDELLEDRFTPFA